MEQVGKCPAVKVSVLLCWVWVGQVSWEGKNCFIETKMRGFQLNLSFLGAVELGKAFMSAQHKRETGEGQPRKERTSDKDLLKPSGELNEELSFPFNEVEGVTQCEQAADTSRTPHTGDVPWKSSVPGDVEGAKPNTDQTISWKSLGGAEHPDWG